MNRTLRIAGALALVAAGVALLPRTAAPRCSYIARFPEAIGRHTFIMANATDRTVEITISGRTVPAQLMRVESVAGLAADSIRSGLRSSDGTAVFVRHVISPSCGPMPASDGALDSVGTRGLYIGAPRPMSAWIAGRPTFDVLRAEHQPLPERVDRPRNSGHLVFTRPDTGTLMSADALFDLYGTLWTESVAIGDTSVWIRARDWLGRNQANARKHPAREVIDRAVRMVEEARTYGRPVPYGGTFAITVMTPRGDSAMLYARTMTQPRAWMWDVAKDSASGITTRAIARSFAVDLWIANSFETFREDRVGPPGTCATIPIIVDRMPIVPRGDSTWAGELHLSGLDQCAPEGSVLRRVLIGPDGREVIGGPIPVKIGKDGRGGVAIEASAERQGRLLMTLRGERTSETTAGVPAPEAAPPQRGIRP